ncbi:MAG: flagellar motor switch protein FliM [Acidobacteria bacterium]|nr:flagellar motor switch protein FliM [Acidobacteriota bacterium]
MSKILSQEEIDALLAAADEGLAEPSARTTAIRETATRYNFRRPDRVSKEQIHSLQLVHDRYARNLATSLSAYLRTITELSVVSVEQFSYSEFLMSLSDPTAFYALSIAPFEDLGALEVNPAIAFSIVDRMLGGNGTGTAPNRALSEIEQNVIDSVVKLILDALSETWRALTPLTFAVKARETRPQMLQVSGPNEVVVMIAFDMRIGSARGMMNLCLPASLIEAVGVHFGQAWHKQRRDPNDLERGWIRDNLSRVPMSLTALLETRLRTADLMALVPGDVLSLGLRADAPIELRVGDSRKFSGHLTRHGGRVGVRIDRRADPGGVEA